MPAAGNYDLDSSSDSESSVGESCDPCDGRAPCLLHVGIALLGVAKMIVVAPIALIIMVVCSIVAMGLSWPFGILYGLYVLLTLCKFPVCLTGPHSSGCGFTIDGIWKARLYIVMYPLVCEPLWLGAFLLVAPVFAVVKPMMDTWTAWKWQKVWGFGPMMLGQEQHWGERGRTVKASFSMWSKAREDCGNGTLSVLCEACALGGAGPFMIIFGYFEKLSYWRIYHKTFEHVEALVYGSGTQPTIEGDMAWEAFFQELLQVGESAIKAGLLTRTECQELDPFLMLGLPGLVLLRYVVRTCIDDESDKPVTELLHFLAKTYRDQGEGTYEHFDGHNIIVYDESEDYAEQDWLDAKEVVEQQAFFDADSDAGDGDEDGHNEYAIFEAWVLFGERPDNSELQGKATDFLDAFARLPEARRVGMNRAASKIREVALVITKAPSFQERFMKVMEELGKERKWWCF